MKTHPVDVITPEDAGWDAARAAWNLLADQHPALIVQAADAADVAEAVRYARARPADLRRTW